MKSTLFLVLALAFCGLGCTNSYSVSRPQAALAPAKLSPDAKYYIAIPEDSTEYRGSGKETADAMGTAFGEYARQLQFAAKAGSLDEALAEAAARGCTYLVYPRILHWEDRATEWSGMPDRIRIQVTIAQCATKNTVDTVTLEGTSKWATFGGDHPQDMLLPAFRKYAASLFK